MKTVMMQMCSCGKRVLTQSIICDKCYHSFCNDRCKKEYAEYHKRFCTQERVLGLSDSSKQADVINFMNTGLFKHLEMAAIFYTRLLWVRYGVRILCFASSDGYFDLKTPHELREVYKNITNSADKTLEYVETFDPTQQIVMSIAAGSMNVTYRMRPIISAEMLRDMLRTKV